MKKMFGWQKAKRPTTFTFDSKPFLPTKDSDAFSTTTKGLSPLIQEMRLIKSEAEIKIMREAGEISGKAFIEVTLNDDYLIFIMTLCENG
jgi:intermediate cleaving peptidase 55